MLSGKKSGVKSLSGTLTREKGVGTSKDNVDRPVPKNVVSGEEIGMWLTTPKMEDGIQFRPCGMDKYKVQDKESKGLLLSLTPPRASSPRVVIYSRVHVLFSPLWPPSHLKGHAMRNALRFPANQGRF